MSTTMFRVVAFATFRNVAHQNKITSALSTDHDIFAIDVMGLYHLTLSGYHNIIVLMDMMSHWVEAKAVYRIH